MSISEKEIVKMKTKHVVLSLVSLCTGLSVFANPMIPSPLISNIPGVQFKDLSKKQTDEVDLAKANSLLQIITNQVLATEDQVKFAYPKFDTQLSNLKNEHLVYGVTSAVTKTQWGSDLALTATTEYQTDRVSPLPGIKVNFSAQINTDILAMTRFATQTVLQKGTDFIDDPQHVAILTRASKVSTLADLYQLMLDSQAQAILETQELIKTYHDQVACLDAMTCGDVTVDQWGNRHPDDAAIMGEELMVDELYREQASYESVTITFDQANQQIIALAPAPQGFLATANEGVLKMVKMVFTTQQVSTNGSLFAAAKIEKLDELHSDLKADLVGVIGNDASTVATVQEAFRNALVDFKKAINLNYNL
jgi:hypothetical protein